MTFNGDYSFMNLIADSFAVFRVGCCTLYPGIPAKSEISDYEVRTPTYLIKWECDVAELKASQSKDYLFWAEHLFSRAASTRTKDALCKIPAENAVASDGWVTSPSTPPPTA
jgi:hypothetical protein